MAKSPNLCLTVHIRFFVFGDLQAKFFQNYVLSFDKISSELYKFCAIRQESRE